MNIAPDKRVKRLSDYRLAPVLGTVRAVFPNDGIAVVTWDNDPRPKRVELRALTLV